MAGIQQSSQGQLNFSNRALPNFSDHPFFCPMPRSEPTNEYERKLLKNVEVHGWQCTSVAAEEGDETSPPFSYSIGLFQSYGCPEFIIIGLPGDTAHAMLSILASAAREGNPIPLDGPCAGLVKGFECVFVEVPRAAYEGHVLSALWFYEEADFPLYQIVWPSRDGHYPWHPETTESFRAWQPVLARGDNA